MFISVDNLSNNTILSGTFTVFGSFGITAAKKIKKLVRYIAREPKRKKNTFDVTIQCKLTTSTGGAVTNGTGAVTIDFSANRWQADFTNVAPGINYKLVYSITAGTTQQGTPITGLRVPQGGLPITISSTPMASGSVGSTGRTYAPTGLFGSALDPFAVSNFVSWIVIGGVLKDTKDILNFEVILKTINEWDLSLPHVFDQPASTSASHVIQLTMNDNSVRRAGRLGL